MHISDMRCAHTTCFGDGCTQLFLIAIVAVRSFGSVLRTPQNTANECVRAKRALVAHTLCSEDNT